MYEPLHSKSAVAALSDWIVQFDRDTDGLTADGLILKTPDGGDAFFESSLRIPPRLQTWLTDLRLLRGIPLAYLVPDARLLPVESIRGFHIDPTWCDRVIDGALSAANIGTVDVTFTLFILSRLRQEIDDMINEMAEKQAPATNWRAADDPMSGLMIRSELVRRWPQLVVRAYRAGSTREPVAVLRKEAVGRDLMIIVFAGVPDRVELREPFFGRRFGVEAGNKVNRRQRNGEYTLDQNGNPATLRVGFKAGGETERILDIAGLANTLEKRILIAREEQRTIGPIGGRGPASIDRTGRALQTLNMEVGSSLVALTLEQLPYVQVLKSGVPESKGRINCITRKIVPIEPTPITPLGGGPRFRPTNQRGAEQIGRTGRTGPRATTGRQFHRPR